MRRTREWWTRLTKGERIYLIAYEKVMAKCGGVGSRSAYYPDDCVACPMCGNPTLGYCECDKEADRIIAKAERTKIELQVESEV